MSDSDKPSYGSPDEARPSAPREAAREASRAAVAEDRRSRRPEAEEDAWERFTANVKTIGGAVLLAIFIRVVLFEAFQIDGPSMEPTLYHGDRVVVAKYVYGLFPHPWAEHAVLTWGAPNRGDVVIVHSPMDNQDIVKRVIGVGGDRIEIVDGQIILNGEPIVAVDEGPCAVDAQKEVHPDCHDYRENIDGHPYLTSHESYWEGEYLGTFEPQTVPEGHVFVMGDHRDQSNDSRNPLVGMIPISRVKGRALFVYLSADPESVDWWWNRMRWNRIGTTIE